VVIVLVDTCVALHAVLDAQAPSSLTVSAVENLLWVGLVAERNDPLSDDSARLDLRTDGLAALVVVETTAEAHRHY